MDKRLTTIAETLGLLPHAVREFAQRIEAASVGDLVKILNEMGNKYDAIAKAIASVLECPLWPSEGPYPKVVVVKDGYVIASNYTLYAVNPLAPESFREALDQHGDNIRELGVIPASVVSKIRGMTVQSSGPGVDGKVDPDGGEEVKDIASLGATLDRLVNQAAESDASDVYIVPTDQATVIRMKIDGEARTTEMIQMDPTARENAHVALSSVLLNAIGKQANGYFRETVDGAFIFNTARGQRLKVRVAGLPASLPTTREVYHKYTLRLLGNRSDIISLDDLQLPNYEGNNQQDQLRFLSENKNGIVLLTGPTSSGKTTTLTAMLQSVTKLNPTKMIHTVEDPVEIFVSGVVHSQIEPTLTYPQALKNLLRQAPDIILVGEIRDDEVALLSVQAAQTGHLVLSTLHTNNSLGTFGRLRKLNIDDYDMADVTRGIMGQRLVKVVCQKCASRAKWGELKKGTDKRLDDPERRDMRQRYSTIKDNYDDLICAMSDSDEVLIPSRAGCPACNNTGYKGRRLVSELLMMSGELGDLLLARASPSHLHWVARESYQFVEMWDYAMYLIKNQVLSFDHAYAAIGPRLGQIHKPTSS